jgi:glycosyltransferase involved in cell wall biosynthesis
VRLLSVIHGPTWGGAHNQALTLADPLRKLGVETHVLLPLEADTAARRLERGGVAARRIPLSRLRAVGDPRPNLRLALRARREIRAIGDLIDALEIDVVQAHGPTNPQAALAAARRDGVATAWQLLDSRTPAPLVRLTMPWVARHADVISTWGEALAELHPPAATLGERCVTVFPPVAAERFTPDPERRGVARERLGLDAEQVAVGAVGVLTPQKGHEHLLEAARILGTGAGPQAAGGGTASFALRVIGAPSDAHPEYVKGLRSRAAALAGAVDAGFADPGETVPLLLQGLDVFALASVGRSEGMPTAILEAMCAGKPVVATDVGAVRELVEEGRTGLLVPPGDPEALAAALGRLITDGELRARLGAAGRELALERFSLDELARRHRDAYELALAHRRGADAANVRCAPL